MRLNTLAKYAFISILLVLVIIIGWSALIGSASYKMYSSYTYFSQPPRTTDNVVNNLMATCLDHDFHSFFSMNRLFEHQDTSLAAPTYSNDKLAMWITNTLPQVMKFNYSNIKQQLLNDQQYFTPHGWCHFIDALASANIIDATITRKLEVNITLDGTSTITTGSVKDGVYIWTVETPVSFIFETDDTETAAPPKVSNEKLLVRISRSSSKTNPDGIGISQWVTVNAQ